MLWLDAAGLIANSPVLHRAVGQPPIRAKHHAFAAPDSSASSPVDQDITER